MMPLILLCVLSIAGNILVAMASAARGYKRGHDAGFRAGHEAGRYAECRWWAETDQEVQTAEREGKR